MLMVAGATSGLVTHFAVAAVISVVQRVGLLATWRASGGLLALTLAGNLAVAAAVIALYSYSLTALLAVPALGILVHQRYVGRLRTHEEREAGKRKSVALGQLTADLDEPGVIRRTAKEAAALTDAHIVEVEMALGDTSDRSLHRYHREGHHWSGTPTEAPALDGRLIAQIPLTVEGRNLGGEIRVWLEAGAANVRLSAADTEALGILSATASAALANARAHAQQTLLATTDRTTGLPIRSVLIDRIESTSLRRGESGLPSIALILIDITGFRGVVRTLGHDAAEALLAHTGKQLDRARQPEEFLAVVGGDDFGIYISDTSGPAHVRRRALGLLDAVVEPLELAVGAVTLGAVAGIAYSRTPVSLGADLLRQATVALEEARARDLRVDFYDPALDVLGGPAAVVMEAELHDALSTSHELEMQYQPILDLASGVPVVVEAFARWKHPTKGLMLAGEFMPVLERSADHPAFVSWCLDQAVKMHALWSSDRDLPISINLAGRCLLDTSLPDEVASTLARSGVPANQLMLEFADGPTLTGSATAARVLGELRTLGVRVAIDDLGFCYSPSANLLQVPATDVKIGSRFVNSLLSDDHAAAIVRMVIEFARHADLRVIALGVPDETHADALASAGCEAAQGPHFASPMWSRELRDYLAVAPNVSTQEEAAVIDLDQRRRAAWPSTT